MFGHLNIFIENKLKIAQKLFSTKISELVLAKHEL